MTTLLPIEPFIDQIVTIERFAHSHPWSENLLRKTQGKYDCYRALVENNQIIGYFYSQCVAQEASLLNLTITPSLQGKGFGKILLNHFLTEMKARKATEAWLEVRASNLVAIKLYESLGFNVFDRRYDYYLTAKDREDALVMGYWFE